MIRFADPGGRVYGSVGTSLTNLAQYWGGITNTAGVVVSAGNGRTTGSALYFSSNGNSPTYMTRRIDNQATLGVAFALKRVRGFSSTVRLIEFFDSSTSQVDLRLNTDNTLSVTRNGTTLGTTSTAILTSSTWVHIELKVTFNSSTGTVLLNVNGASNLSLTSQNTRASSNNYANSINIGINGSSVDGDLYMDDIVIYDGQTTDAIGNTAVTGPLGDVGVSWLLPTGAGNSTDFTPDSGSNYARVNETTLDATSYVESLTVGAIDTYVMGDLSGTVGTILSVAAVINAKKTDVGSRTASTVVRNSGTNYVHPSGLALSNSFQYSFTSWDQNPGTTAAWTASEVNALEMGHKITA